MKKIIDIKICGYLFIHMQEKCRQSEMFRFMQKGRDTCNCGRIGLWKVGYIKSCDGADCTKPPGEIGKGKSDFISRKKYSQAVRKRMERV